MLKEAGENPGADLDALAEKADTDYKSAQAVMALCEQQLTDNLADFSPFCDSIDSKLYRAQGGQLITKKTSADEGWFKTAQKPKEVKSKPCRAVPKQNKAAVARMFSRYACMSNVRGSFDDQRKASQEMDVVEATKLVIMFIVYCSVFSIQYSVFSVWCLVFSIYESFITLENPTKLVYASQP